MPVVLLSIFVSLLPRRYRGHWLGDGNLDVRRGAILSSVLQFVGCCAAGLGKSARNPAPVGTLVELA